MARFDLYRGDPGWLLDVQSELTDGLPTRVVVPLVPLAGAPPPLGELNPVFEVEGVSHQLMPQWLAATPRRALGRPESSLAHERDAITRALDLLFTGF
jgi:toxin CcdB